MNQSYQLGDTAANVLENLACRVAEHNGGKITACHLLPYLPLSLEAISHCLGEMVDDQAVLRDEEDGIVCYEFAAFGGKEPERPRALKFSECLSCGTPRQHFSAQILCASCDRSFKAALNDLSDKTGWPAQAVYEHELVYIAANQPPPHHPEKIAARSRYTIKNTQAKLQKMTLAQFIRQKLSDSGGLIEYEFPAVTYPRDRFMQNMQVIRNYPSSVVEEVELKLIRIFFALGLLVLGLFILAICRIPFPALTLMFMLAAPAISVYIWMRRYKPPEDLPGPQ